LKNKNNKIVGISVLVLALVAIPTTTTAFGQLPPPLQETYNREELLNSLAQGVVLRAGVGEEAINATSTTASNATTTTTTTTNNATTNATKPPERLYIERLQSEDPSFQAFGDILLNCAEGTVFGNGSFSHIQCLSNLQDGIDKWCGIEAYDELKCEYSQTAMGMYQGIALASQLGDGGP
jgi:hypothetical protein